MASFATACRLSAHVARRKLAPEVAARGFRTSAAALAAQNFTMPALSPTMTEGNIAAWRVKEGEKFSAGDVILEIETDKATMDVEAQEDGIMMKIMQGDGSKAVPVGVRIAVIAEEGDDISALEIPADESPKKTAAAPAKTETAQQQPAAQTQTAPQKPTPRPAGGKAPKQTYPLLPSVQHLMKENGLEESAIGDMTPTGPNGRLLKGDVLAYLGKINANTPTDVKTRFEKAAHLDLSNIKTAKAPEAAKKPAAAAPAVAEPPVPKDALVSLGVSLAEVVKVQTKIKDTLGVFLPLSTFIGRAADVANDELPLPAGAKPSADELFNQVLGLDKVGSKTSRGSYLPQISAVPPASFFGPRAASKMSDIIDLLAGAPRPSQKPRVQLVPGMSASSTNVFSLVVPQPEERRAKVFLERVKTVLEKEPGRLVL